MNRIAILFSFIFLHGLAYSQIGGLGTYQFLNLTNSARVASLGGNNISIFDDDLNLSFYNPALLNPSMSKQLVINYVNYFADIKFGYVSFSRDFGKYGSYAIGMHHINYGSFTGADEYGNETGSFNAKEYAINILWSKSLIDSSLTFGFNLKPVLSNLESYSSYGVVGDFGINYYNKKNLFDIAFVLKNFGSQIKPYHDRNFEPIAYDIQLGLSKRLEHAPIRFSLTLQHLQKWDLSYEKSDESDESLNSLPDNSIKKSTLEKNASNLFKHVLIGIEFLPSKNFHIRLGYNHQRRQEMSYGSNSKLTGFSFGFGLKISKFHLSYGRATYHIAGSSNHFSLSTNLSELYSKSEKVKNTIE